MKKMLFLGTFCLVVLLGVSFPIYGAETVKIGIIKPLTGPVAYDGRNWVTGAQIAAEEINKAGGALGRQIELVVEDGMCVPAESVNAAEKLITRSKVVAIMGCYCSSSSGAVMEVVKKYQIPQMTGISTSPKLTELGNPWFFRATANSNLYADSFAKGILDLTQAKQIAFLVVNDDWGRGTIDAFSSRFEKLGAKIVAKDVFAPNESDFYPFLTKIKALNPDVLYVVANTEPAAKIAKQFDEVGMKAKLFGEGPWAQESFIKLAGKAAEGKYSLVKYVYTIPGERNARLVSEFRKRANEAPPQEFLAGYTCTHIMAEGIKRAGGTDAEKLRLALEKTDYDGLNGKYRFDEKHQAYGFDLYLTQTQNANPVVVKQVRVGKP